MIEKNDIPDSREAHRVEREFEELFRRHEGALGRFLAQMTRDRDLADDLLQETFLTAFRDIAALPRELSDQRAWLFTVARHRALHALRGRRRQRELLERVAAGVAARPTEPSDEPTWLRDLLVRTLSPKDRSLLLCRYVFGFTAEELARMTNQTPAAVRQRLSRARARLSSRLAEDCPPPYSVPEGGPQL